MNLNSLSTCISKPLNLPQKQYTFVLTFIIQIKAFLKFPYAMDEFQTNIFEHARS